MIINQDCVAGVRALDEASVDCVITSPPYWGLRDYHTPGAWGLEETFGEHVDRLAMLFSEIRRVLKPSGSIWINYGDAYAGSSGSLRHAPEPGDGPRRKTGDERNVERRRSYDVPSGCLIGMPWSVAFALVSDGWILRQDVVWAKPNPMPESVKNRCTRSHEFLFHLVPRMGYYWNAEAMREPAVYPAGTRAAKGSAERHLEPGVNARPPEYKIYDGYRNRRDVWTISPARFSEAHFATFPPELIRPAILATCPPGGLVLDPFAGAGTTWLVAKEEGRRFIGFDVNPDYCEMARRRVAAVARQEVFA